MWNNYGFCLEEGQGFAKTLKLYLFMYYVSMVKLRLWLFHQMHTRLLNING